MSTLSIKHIAHAIISGIEKAQIDYAEMSGGEWVWTAAEYVLTTYIAKEIHSLPGSKFVTIENNGLSALGDANAIGPGPKPRKARLDGRFDLVLWWANATPRAIIEVKNQPTGPKGWFHDIERITTVLNMKKDDSSFRFGVFAYYYSARDGKQRSAEEKVEFKFERVEQYIKNKLSNKFRVKQFVSQLHSEGEFGAWGAACVVITRI